MEEKNIAEPKEEITKETKEDTDTKEATLEAEVGSFIFFGFILGLIISYIFFKNNNDINNYLFWSILICSGITGSITATIIIEILHKYKIRLFILLILVIFILSIRLIYY